MEERALMNPYQRQLYETVMDNQENMVFVGKKGILALNGSMPLLRTSFPLDVAKGSCGQACMTWVGLP